MEAEATSAGFYTPEHFPDNHYPRIQILTIEELLAGARADYPTPGPGYHLPPRTPAPAFRRGSVQVRRVDQHP